MSFTSSGERRRGEKKGEREEREKEKRIEIFAPKRINEKCCDNHMDYKCPKTFVFSGAFFVFKKTRLLLTKSNNVCIMTLKVLLRIQIDS